MSELKTMLVLALGAIAILSPASVAARNVHSPVAGVVTTTTYYKSGYPHRAVDVAPYGGCGSKNVNTAVAGSLYWNVTINTSSKVCNGNGSGRQNQARHNFSNGWAFRQWHFNRSGSSYDRTCDRCTIGKAGGTGNASGPHAHLQRERYGTLTIGWYTRIKHPPYRGKSVSTGTVIGAM